MRYVKMIVLLCCFICCPVVLTGCRIAFWDTTQINNIEFIRAVGVDKADNGNIRFTIATQRIISGGARGGSEQKQCEIVYSEGRTSFEAMRNFWSYSEKRPFLGHLEFILIGEEAAKEGILKYLDFFTRDAEVRLNLNVFVVKGNDAGEVIRQGNAQDKFVFDRLEGIKRHDWGLSIINDVNLMEIMYILDAKYLSLYIPCVRLLNRAETTEESRDGMEIALEGFAVFDGDKVAGYLDKEMARGLNFLKNKLKSGVVNVRSKNGTMVALEIISGGSKMKPYIKDGELHIAVEVEMDSSIAEIQGPENIFSDDSLEYLEKQQEQAIMDEVRKTIDFAQEKKLDFFGAGDAVLHKYPYEWEDFYEKDWRDVFSQVEFEITARSKISRTYDIKQPIGAKDIR